MRTRGALGARARAGIGVGHSRSAGWRRGGRSRPGDDGGRAKRERQASISAGTRRASKGVLSGRSFEDVEAPQDRHRVRTRGALGPRGHAQGGWRPLTFFGTATRWTQPTGRRRRPCRRDRPHVRGERDKESAPGRYCDDWALVTQRASKRAKPGRSCEGEAAPRDMHGVRTRGALGPQERAAVGVSHSLTAEWRRGGRSRPGAVPAGSAARQRR